MTESQRAAESRTPSKLTAKKKEKKKEITEPPSTSDKSRDRQTCWSGGGDDEVEGWPLLGAVKAGGGKKKKEEKRREEERKSQPYGLRSPGRAASALLHGGDQRQNMARCSSLRPAELIGCQPLVDSGGYG